MNNNELLHLSPMESYTPPALPTLADKPKLQKLPTRWQRNAAVVACIGIVGGMTLAGCMGATEANPANTTAPYSTAYAQTVAAAITSETETTTEAVETTEAHTTAQTTITTATTQTTQTRQTVTAAVAYSEFNLNVRLHGGGSGSAMYVVHLTEQEAQGIIRSQLEAAGLNFGATPPRVILNDGDSWGPNFALDLFDREHNVAISHISWVDNNQAFFSWGGSDLAQRTAEEFSQHRQLRNVNVGVFYNPGVTVGTPSLWIEDGAAIAPTDTEVITAAPLLQENLTAQVQTFIEFLQSEGIL